MADSDKRSSAEPGQLGDTIQLVKQYAKQETVGPLKNAGRFLAFGMLGSVLLGVASVLLVLGSLRLMQTEFAPTFAGRWMRMLPYVIALAVAALVIGIAISRIGKRTLDPRKPAQTSAPSKETR